MSNSLPGTTSLQVECMLCWIPCPVLLSIGFIRGENHLSASWWGFTALIHTLDPLLPCTSLPGHHSTSFPALDPPLPCISLHCHPILHFTAKVPAHIISWPHHCSALHCQVTSPHHVIPWTHPYPARE